MLRNEPYRLDGTRGSACLLLHGLGGGTYEMQPLGEYLHRQTGRTVQAILYPGHESGAQRMRASTWPEWFSAVCTAYQELRERCGSVSLIGLSTGCPLALHLAANQPVERLVLLAPFVRIRRPWFSPLPPAVYLHTVGRLIDELPFRLLCLRDGEMRRQAEQANTLKSFNLHSVRSALELIARVRSELPAIHTPTLILQSRYDSVVDPTGAADLMARLGGARNRLHWLTDSDHLLPLDRERQTVCEQVAAFLEAN